MGLLSPVMMDWISLISQILSFGTSNNSQRIKQMTTKICESCRAEKPLVEFVKTKGIYLSRKCKQCLKGKCRNKNCDRMVYGKALCSQCIRKNNNSPPRKRPSTQSMNVWLNQCLRSTKSCSLSRAARGYRVKENDLTIEFLIDMLEKQNGLCAVSGLKLLSEYNNICSASIDRIDSGLGYLQNNVLLVCQWVNLGRKTTPIDEFKKVLLSIPRSALS